MNDRMTSEQLLRELLTCHDEGDQAGISRLLAQHRTILLPATDLSQASSNGRSAPDRSTIVSVENFENQLIVRPVGPAVGEREALVIRTEVNRALLDRTEPLQRLVVDLENVATISASVLRLVTDLRRSASVLGATTDAIGVPEDIAQPIRRMRLDSRRPRRFTAVMRSILP